MKKLSVLREMSYKGSNIFVLNMDTMFMYIFHFEGKLYQQHVFARPRFVMRIGSWFGKEMYTKEELIEVEKAMLSGAVDSIDLLCAEKVTSAVKPKESLVENLDIIPIPVEA